MIKPIETPADALLFLQFPQRFTEPETQGHYVGLTKVLQSLMRKVEDQAAMIERLEAVHEPR